MAWSDVGYSLGFKMDMQLEDATKSVGTSYLTPSAQVLFSIAIQESCANSKKGIRDLQWTVHDQTN